MSSKSLEVELLHKLKNKKTGTAREEDGPSDSYSNGASASMDSLPSLGPDVEVEDLVSHEDPMTIYINMQPLGQG